MNAAMRKLASKLFDTCMRAFLGTFPAQNGTFPTPPSPQDCTGIDEIKKLTRVRI